MTQRSMTDFAVQWADAWNRRAIEDVLQHFHDEVVFVSPTALVVTGSAVVRGKSALREYWTRAMAGIASLRFVVDRALWDAERRELAILYTSSIDGRARRVSENLIFDADGKIVAAEVFHGIAGEHSP
jgi:hypothetical protein